MAIINFPPTAGQPTDGSFTYTFDGILYSWTGSYWSANSQSGFDSKYVEVAGDNMTGDLTLGTDKITLSAADGKITTVGNVRSGDFGTSGPATGCNINKAGWVGVAAESVSTDRAMWQAYLDGKQTSVIRAAGDAIFAGDIQSTSQNGGQLAGFRNQLLNPYHSINQRGQGAITVGTAVQAHYTGSDRWVVMPTVSNTSVTTRVYPDSVPTNLNTPSRAALYASADGSSGGTFNMGQFIELPESSLGAFQPGTEWTLTFFIQAFTSFDINANLILSGGSSLSFTAALASTNGPITLAGTGYQKCVLNFTIPNDGSWVPSAQAPCLLVRLNIADGAAAREVWLGSAQLEPGPVATPFEHRPIGTELALCQRYYMLTQFSQQGSAPINGYVGQWLPFKTVMRATPTVGITQIGGKFPTSLPDPVVSNPENNGLRISILNNTGADAPNIAYQCYLFADAEL